MSVELLHTTADVTRCDCCGRDDLKRTVKIAVDGKAAYYGTGCAAKAYSAQWATPEDVQKAARKADRAHKAEALRSEQATRNWLRAAELYCLNAVAREHGYPDWDAVTEALPFAEFKALAAEARRRL